MFILPEEVKIELVEYYRKNLELFLKGQIPPSRFRGIRVPWGIYSHRGGEVFMVRIRIPSGFLLPEQLRALAESSKKFGDGNLHITTRQDIQIHNVKIENTYPLMNYLKDYNLSPRGGGGNTVRNITGCPFSGICKYEILDVRKYAIPLTEHLLRKNESYNLPRKFKISFSGCMMDCSGALVNDIGFIAKKRNGEIGFSVYCGGGMGLISKKGELLEDFIYPEDVGYVVESVKNVYYFKGDRRNKHHNRLRFLIEDIGFEEFRKLYKEEIKRLKNEEYIFLRNVEFKEYEGEDEEIPYIDDEKFRNFLKYNVFHQKQKGFATVKLRIPRGDLSSEKAIELYNLKDEFGNIEFRLTQNQNIAISWIEKKQLYKIFCLLKDIFGDEFLYPDTLVDVVCCKGALTCNLGLCNSVGLSKEIERVIFEDFLKSKIFEKFDIKINGCPNACGQHPVGFFSFHGVVRKVYNRTVPFYKFLIGGKKEGEKTTLSEEIGIIPAKNIPSFLKEFLSSLKEEIFENKEKIKEMAKGIIERYAYVPPYSENPDFYKDWGKDEVFSLSGLGRGECGAGVIDMIESDISEAKINIEKFEKEMNYIYVKKIILLSARALLIVKGIDPEREEEVFDEFIDKFIREGIGDERFLNLKEIYNELNENIEIERLKEIFNYAKDFYNHIVSLYQSMDPSFNFPVKRKKDVFKKENFLDLKGTPCPLNYVKAKIFLENLEKGDIVEILLDEGEPIENVPKSLENDGHKILSIEREGNFYRVKVEKNGGRR